jgi:hypothetical protein
LEARYFIYIFFLSILKKYTTVSKFSKSHHQPPWRTAVVVAHGSCKTKRCKLRRFGQPPRGLRAVNPAVVAHRGIVVGYGGKPNRRGVRRQAQPSWPTTVSFAATVAHGGKLCGRCGPRRQGLRPEEPKISPRLSQ